MSSNRRCRVTDDLVVPIVLAIAGIVVVADVGIVAGGAGVCVVCGTALDA
jgi:hypothetical protein